MTFGKSPFPRCIKMNRIGGAPVRLEPIGAAESLGIMPGMDIPPIARKAFRMNSRLLFMVVFVVGLWMI